jgi:hypothetical protein
MDVLLANPKLLIAGVIIILLVLGANWALLSAFRGDKSAAERAAKWGKAMRGNAQAQQQQQADLDELHRRVTELKAKHDD